jgi:hypothetical protein
MAKRVQTSNWYLIARESGEPSKMGKQKTAFKAGAPVDDARKWNSIDWKFAQRQARRLQMRIAKAVKALSSRICSIVEETTEDHNTCGVVSSSTSSKDILGGTQAGRPLRAAFGMLEPCDGKLSRTVLRGEGG